MNIPAIRYAVLRDRRQWDDGVAITGLQKQPDGVLTLASIPGLGERQKVSIGSPFEVEPSGLAVGPHGDLYIANTDSNRVIYFGSRCKTRVELAEFQKPGSLLIVEDNLYVADSGNARVLMFFLPTLELRAVWQGPFKDPTGLAADSLGKVYVLDRGLNQVLRFSEAGEIDINYNSTMAKRWPVSSPQSLAIDGNSKLYVSDKRSNRVWRFDASGKSLGAIPTPNTANLTKPRALAAQRDRLYIADADTGLIWLFDCVGDAYVGSLAAYRGPVTALALDDQGSLFIKPGLDKTFHQLPADLACVAEGKLEAGPLDAGGLGQWERVHVDVEVPAGTEAILYTHVSNDDNLGPGTEQDWKQEPSLDVLLPLRDLERRFLWLRVVLKSTGQVGSPRVLQVQAQTTRESYLDYLPAIYRRDDAATQFLERWLVLFRSQLSDWESRLEEMPQRFDPQTTPEDHLEWLAQWLAFALPADYDPKRWRHVLQRVHDLYQRRGTPYGMREFVELYTGATPHIFEAYRERRLWQLGHTSRLGFDTALAATLPNGMIVPGTTTIDPRFMGLKADYYAGIHLDRLVLTRTDRWVNFAWVDKSPSEPDSWVPIDGFSVRWTGQVRPRYSENYTFHTISDDGVRLWVDGRLIIDNWTDHSPTEDTGRIALTADRWYPITLEFYEKGGHATMKLFWSSRSQRQEIVPEERLYSLVDETATLPSDPETAVTTETVLFGQTVVGESGPLAQAEFGATLSSDTAHLFTVVVPGAQIPNRNRRARLREVVESEKPAHTDFHLCLPEANMRVGFQARLGIDSIVAGPPKGMLLSDAALGLNSYLGDNELGIATTRVGQSAHVGLDATVE